MNSMSREDVWTYLRTCTDWWAEDGLPEDPQPAPPATIGEYHAAGIRRVAESLSKIMHQAHA